jgi:hypothetical protein
MLPDIELKKPNKSGYHGWPGMCTWGQGQVTCVCN